MCQIYLEFSVAEKFLHRKIGYFSLNLAYYYAANRYLIILYTLAIWINTWWQCHTCIDWIYWCCCCCYCQMTFYIFDNTCEQCNLDKTGVKMKCKGKDQSYVCIAVMTNRSFAQFVAVILIAVRQHTVHRVQVYLNSNFPLFKNVYNTQKVVTTMQLAG